MPTYDYECGACGHRYEMFQSITAKPVKKCPKCGRQTAKRLIGTGGGIIFKGSGFYATDYRSEGYKKAAAADCGTGSCKCENKDTSKKQASNNGQSSSGGNGSPKKGKSKD